MTKAATTVPRIDHFFSAVAARMDRWRDLNRAAQTRAPAPNEREYDLTLSYKVLEGALRALSFDLKGAVLDYTNSGRTGLQLRLIMNYEFNLL